MPKAKPGELAALREEVLTRDEDCVWPTCDRPWNMPLELAHLHHRGMGGSTEANTAANCVMMCQFHHSIYDGRIVGASARSEWASLFQHLAGIR